MPTPPKPILYISYSHADEPARPGPDEVKWLSFVTGYLRPAVTFGALEIWSDAQLDAGANWQQETEHKLRACDIFVLLVSPPRSSLGGVGGGALHGIDRIFGDLLRPLAADPRGNPPPDPPPGPHGVKARSLPPDIPPRDLDFSRKFRAENSDGRDRINRNFFVCV